MTPGARAAAAIEVLDQWLAGRGRAERLLRDWGRSNRYAGSKDRRAIQDIVYACLRRQRSYAWSNAAEGGRGLVIGHCLAEGPPPATLFTGEGYAPARLEAAEVTARGPAPDPVAHDHPDWLEAPLKAALGTEYAAAMTALGARAPLDLRVNTLKASQKGAQAALQEDGIETETVPLCATALRAAPGARVTGTNAYRDGLVEIQDTASQAAVALADARAGMTVLDYCAGGGGKTLALAAAIENKGRLIAHDIAPERMKDIPERARRAGARIDVRSDLTSLRGACDLVFVDAPCSGSGTWRREPEAKWALTQERLDELVAMQTEAFDAALAYMKPGGRIVYATCSILREENEAHVTEIAKRHTHLKETARLRLVPSEHSDGFFAISYEDQRSVD